MFRPSGSTPIFDHLGAQFLEDGGGDPVGRAVGAVEHDAQPLQGAVGGEHGFQVDHVAAHGVVHAEGLAHLGGGGAHVIEIVAEGVALDLRLHLVGKLEAVAARRT